MGKREDLEVIKQFIDNYMNSNEVFARDLTLLRQVLEYKRQTNGEQNQPIVVFTHQMDINSISNSSELVIKTVLKPKFSNVFEKHLKRRVEPLLDNQFIWFCLKYKNLPENRNVKTYNELMSNTKQLFSIDCLQIVSLSQTFESVIGRKFETKAPNVSIEWRFKRLDEQDFSALSDDLSNYREIKEDRVFTTNRQIVATIGSKDNQKSPKPMNITLILDVFDEKEAESVYNGSHLQSVVLLQTESNEYLLLSFDKMIEPIPQLINDFEQYLLQFPQELIELFIDRKQSNYSFALSLAFIFGDNISIEGSFFRLKLGLLLSLLSLDEYPKKNHSSVLVICDDTLIIRRLFEWSSLMSEFSYLQKSVSVPITGKSREQRSNSMEWMDAGALQLGADGITIIGSVPNLNELPNKERTALFHALETNEVIPRQSQPSDPSLTELELKSTVWAMIEDNIDERRYQQKTNKGQTFDWTQVFGMVYRITKPTDNYIYKSSLQTEPNLTLEEWKTTIKLMSTIRPQMTETAEELLQRYYVSRRSFRGSKLNHISFETLISLSKSMAKLSLRLNVSKYDALMAVLLYEESLTTVLSERVSPLLVSPIPHVPKDQMPHFIGPDCDQFMEDFEKTLLEFVRKENPNIQYFNSNEE